LKKRSAKAAWPRSTPRAIAWSTARAPVKVMSPSLAKNEVIRERFRREAKAAQKLAHPNIIEIFDQGETPEGQLYLVMEILQGQTVADLLEKQGSVPLDRTLSIAIQIARAWRAPTTWR
jgi:serine/threonine-protein kinase